MESQLIEDLLDTARAINGKLKLEVRPMDLAEVIEKAEEVVRQKESFSFQDDRGGLAFPNTL